MKCVINNLRKQKYFESVTMIETLNYLFTKKREERNNQIINM